MDVRRRGGGRGGGECGEERRQEGRLCGIA